ncbi:MAG: hypothetical protein R3F43_32500 [bacterium]
MAQRARLHAEIERIQSAGTNMEAGLALGFLRWLARRPRSFHGTSRVMLTDERPNVGRTDAGSFMAMARAASKGGIGLTTVGGHPLRCRAGDRDQQRPRGQPGLLPRMCPPWSSAWRPSSTPSSASWPTTWS